MVGGAHDIVKAAKDLAWTLYVRDVQEKLDKQRADWDRQQPTFVMMMTPPSNEKVNHVIAALTAAVDAGIHQAIGPVIDLVDSIDNGDDKRVAAVKRLRTQIDDALETIRAMKSSHVAVAK